MKIYIFLGAQISIIKSELNLFRTKYSPVHANLKYSVSYVHLDSVRGGEYPINQGGPLPVTFVHTFQNVIKL